MSKIELDQQEKTYLIDGEEYTHDQFEILDEERREKENRKEKIAHNFLCLSSGRRGIIICPRCEYQDVQSRSNYRTTELCEKCENKKYEERKQNMKLERMTEEFPNEFGILRAWEKGRTWMEIDGENTFDIDVYNQVYKTQCGTTAPLEYNTLKDFAENHDCMACKVLMGKSKAKVMTQHEVAKLFVLGIDGKRASSSDGNNYNSETSGVLMHYDTIEAIRMNNGKTIANLQCWSRGFAKCSIGETDYRLPISTILSSVNTTIEEMQKMEILDYKGESFWNTEALLKIEDKLLLFGHDENQMFLVQLPDKNIKTTEQAKKALMPKLIETLENPTIKRQGDLFFVETDLKDKDLENIQKQRFENDYFDMNHGYSDKPKRELKRPQIFKTNHSTARIAEYENLESKFGFGTLTMVKGKVYHDNNQHTSLNLGETWHIVLKNRAVQSWQVPTRGFGGGGD